MCTTIPSRVLQIDGLSALVDTQGHTRAVSLALLEPGSVAIGDYLLVQLGSFACERLDEADALQTLALIDALGRRRRRPSRLSPRRRPSRPRLRRGACFCSGAAEDRVEPRPGLPPPPAAAVAAGVPG